MAPRLVLLALAFGLLIAGPTASQATNPPDGPPSGGTTLGGPSQPNVLLICLDDLGLDRMALSGLSSQPFPTPNIDALAGRGVRFENAWTAPVCTPSRSALLTGRYGRRTGVGFLLPEVGLPDSEQTIAEHLAATNSGYATAAIGKWHVSFFDAGDNAPNDQGFDHFAGVVVGLTDYFDWNRTVDGLTTRCQAYATTQMIDDAIDWIGTQSAASTPWFCYLAPYSIHTPFQAPPAHLHTQDLTGLDPSTDPVPFAAAMTEAVDNELQRLFDSLGPQLDETIVIFTSDNGTEQQILDPAVNPSGGKGTPFETGVGVPLIIAGPMVDSPGRTVSEPVHLVDLFATVAELCGRPVPGNRPDFDSRSLVPILVDANASLGREPIYSELFSNDRSRLPCDFRAARTERYKLVRATCFDLQVGESLFDLQNDPLETQDLLLQPGALSVELEAIRATLSETIDALTDIGLGFATLGTNDCVGSNGALRLRAAGNPVAGDSYAVLVENAAPDTPIALAFSIPSLAAGSLPIPFPLAPIGAPPGCVLEVEPRTNLNLLSNPAGRAGARVEVPAIPGLAGLRLDVQALMVDIALAGTFPIPLVTSNGIRATF